MKLSKKADSGAMVTERATLIRPEFCIVITFFGWICLLGNTVKGLLWLQTPKLINKLSFTFLFTGIKRMIGTVFTFKNEVLQQ